MHLTMDTTEELMHVPSYSEPALKEERARIEECVRSELSHTDEYLLRLLTKSLRPTGYGPVELDLEAERRYMQTLTHGEPIDWPAHFAAAEAKLAAIISASQPHD